MPNKLPKSYREIGTVVFEDVTPAFVPAPAPLVSRCCGTPDRYDGMGHLSDYGRCPDCKEVASFVSEKEFMEGDDD